MATVSDALAPARPIPRTVSRFRFGRLFVHLALLVLVVLWTFPTAGLLVTSFREAEQISRSGWWTALAPSTLLDSSRVGAATAAVPENGGFVIRGNLLDENSNRTITAFGVTANTPGSTPVGESVAMRAGGIMTVQPNGDFEWVSTEAFTHTNRPQVYYVATVSPRATIENYETVLNANGIGRSFVNSMTVALPATIISVMVAAFAAYALAWMKFAGRTLLVIAVVGLIVVPLQMSLIPVLRLHNDVAAILGINGKGYVAVWLAHIAFGLPLAVYLLRNYMVGLPREIMESARIDGASHFNIFTSIVLPLSFPALASIAIFQFLWIWNDLLVALVFLGSQDEQVVLTGRLINLLGTMGDEWHLLTAGAFISILVPLIVFFTLQRYFVRGLLAGSVK